MAPWAWWAARVAVCAAWLASSLAAAIQQVGYNWFSFYRAVGQSRPQAVESVVMVVTFAALALPGLVLWGAPGFVYAQASPFLTGVTSLQENILAWLTPVAIILVMVLGGMAMANRISWGWCIGAIFGIAIAFGAPQIVAWVRGMFGV